MDPVYLRRSNWMESVLGPSKFSRPVEREMIQEC